MRFAWLIFSQATTIKQAVNWNYSEFIPAKIPMEIGHRFFLKPKPSLMIYFIKISLLVNRKLAKSISRFRISLELLRIL